MPEETREPAGPAAPKPAAAKPAAAEPAAAEPAAAEPAAAEPGESDTVPLPLPMPAAAAEPDPPGEPAADPAPPPADGASHRPREGLRIGPWLAGDPEETDPVTLEDPAARPAGPSWTAPTVELRAATARRGRRPRPGTTYTSRSLWDEYGPRGTRRNPVGWIRDHGWIREYGWLIAAACVAALVLACAPRLFTAPDPAWDAIAASPSPVRSTAIPTPAAAPTTAPPSPRVTPTPAPAPTPTARRTTRATRKPAPPPRTRTSRPAQAPVLLGPASDWELWGMLRRYCFEVHRTNEAQLRTGVTPAENNWECRAFGQNVPIDMNAACRHVYGSAAFARFSDPNSAFSWRCYRR